MSPASRRIHQQWSFLHAVYRWFDSAGIAAAVWIAMQYTWTPDWTPYVVVAAVTILTHRMVSEVTGMYRSWRGSRIEKEAACVLVTWLYSAPLVLAMGYFTGYVRPFSRVAVLVWLAVTPAVLVLARILFRKIQYFLRRRGYNSRKYAVCGINQLGFQLADSLQASPEMGLQLLGFYDDRPKERLDTAPARYDKNLGGIDELVEQAKKGDVDIVYITFPMRAEERIRGVLERLGDTTASVYIVPDFFVFELLHARWTNIGGVPVVSVFENPLYGVDGILKRTADLVIAGLLLFGLAIPMAIIAALVKFTSPGSVFFRQRRYGLDGEEIRVWKFRSMTVCEDGPQVKQATANDQRVTPVGKILRATSLDELPQLFNVLGGSMSLVGPRPHASAHNEEYRGQIRGYMLRHKVKPGITGLAQVRGFRGETETLEKMQRRIESDHQYIREWSLWMDLKILLKTFFVLFKRENAY